MGKVLIIVGMRKCLAPVIGGRCAPFRGDPEGTSLSPSSTESAAPVERPAAHLGASEPVSLRSILASFDTFARLAT